MKTNKLKEEFRRVVARIAAQTTLTAAELETFVDRLLYACDIVRPNELTVEGFTKIVSTAIGFFEIARGIESGEYKFQPDELDLIRGIVNETGRNIQ